MLLRDEGKILATYGPTDDISLLLGHAYLNGWLQSGWYFTDYYYVVSATKNAATSKMTYKINSYTYLSDAQTAYNAIYISSLNTLDGKVLFNKASMALSMTANAKIAIGYYYYLKFAPYMSTYY